MKHLKIFLLMLQKDNNLENVFAIEDRKEAIIQGSKLIGQ